MAPFYGWSSTVSRLQSHYEEIVLCNNLVITKYKLKSQYVKLPQL